MGFRQGNRKYQQRSHMKTEVIPPAVSKAATRQPVGHASRLLGRIWRYRVVYLMLLPGMIYFALFRYGPLYLAQIAFKDFQPVLGVEASPWIGFQNFLTFFHSYYFAQLLAN